MIERFPVCKKARAVALARIYLNNANVDFRIICKIQTSNCRYKIKCKLANEAWNCEVGQHVYTNIVCCEFVTI